MEERRTRGSGREREDVGKVKKTVSAKSAGDAVMSSRFLSRALCKEITRFRRLYIYIYV